MTILYNESMAKHTSFKTGGIAKEYIIAESKKEIEDIIKRAKKENKRLYVVGNGSNLLVSDKGIDGIVLKVNINNIEIQNQDENNDIFINVGAGTKMMGLAQILKQKEITGFEELSGIPGTIGGANVMNAGAYGKEMKDIIVETQCIDQDGNIKVLKNEEQKLTYRGSIFTENEYIILQVKIKLKKGTKEQIEMKMMEYEKERKEKQPTTFPSAGSTFKRGEGYITAKLIDECDLKGYSIGGAQISEKHAGFIINKGNATSEDIMNLIKYTKKKVYEKFKIEIQEEIKIIGDFN